MNYEVKGHSSLLLTHHCESTPFGSFEGQKSLFSTELVTDVLVNEVLVELSVSWVDSSNVCEKPED